MTERVCHDPAVESTVSSLTACSDLCDGLSESLPKFTAHLSATKMNVLQISFALLFLFALRGIQYSRSEYPICIGNNHIQGKWILNESVELRKSFVCCGWDPGDYLDAAICGPSTHPRVINTTNIRGSNQYLSQLGARACACDTNEGVFSVQKRERYFWKPDNCSLPEWSAKQFCQLLGSKKILFIGDSTNRQTSTTLMSLITAGQGNCSDRIYSARSDSLVSRVNGSRPLHSVVQSYIKGASALIPDIVIISTGAHFRSISDFERNWDHIIPQLLQLHKHYPRMKFLWKTQNPGHVQCQEEREPLVQYEKRNEQKDIYHWNLHRDYDLISYEYVRNLTANVSRAQLETIPFIQVLDLFPLYLRPDAHSIPRDCLHFCVPGPLNIIGVLLLNKLLNKEI